MNSQLQQLFLYIYLNSGVPYLLVCDIYTAPCHPVIPGNYVASNRETVVKEGMDNIHLNELRAIYRHDLPDPARAGIPLTSRNKQFTNVDVVLNYKSDHSEQSTSLQDRSGILAEGNFMLRRTPTLMNPGLPEETQWKTPRDVTDGLKILRLNIRPIYQKTDYQVPVESGQCLITKPARNTANKLVTPCGEFTESKGNEDAQLIRRIEPNSTTAPVLSVRAFEIESLCGLDILIPRTRV